MSYTYKGLNYKNNSIPVFFLVCVTEYMHIYAYIYIYAQYICIHMYECVHLNMYIEIIDYFLELTGFIMSKHWQLVNIRQMTEFNQKPGFSL